MSDIQKQAIKDLLHLIADKEEIALLKELCSKLPAPYASILNGILDMGGPAVVAAEDKAIDGI